VAAYQPDRLVCLGDSFHDGGAGARLMHENRAALTTLAQGVADWVWVSGNHDPKAPDAMAGRAAKRLDLAGLSAPGIAMTAAVATFLVPSGSQSGNLMTWTETQRLPWGVLILFGGGLALAGGMSGSGLTLWIGQQLAPLSQVHIAVLIIAATAMVIFLTEMTSNLATTATFLPVIAALAVETGNDPLIFVIPVTLAASCAFMLPVATPPNAIVFSSGFLSIPRMIRAGIFLNLIGIGFLSLIAIFLAPKVF